MRRNWSETAKKPQSHSHDMNNDHCSTFIYGFSWEEGA